MYQSLRHYIETLEQQGELIRITAQVDPVLEIGEITDRMSKEPGGGKALLFENTGTSFPVLTNAMGSERRISLALNIPDLALAGKEIESLFAAMTAPKTRLSDKLKMLPLLGRMSRWLPGTSSKRGACQEVILNEPDLSILPILKCWPADGDRFITLPMVHTRHPLTGARNCGMYRMQVMSKNTTGMHWHRHKTGATHYEAWKKLGQLMPVAVALGGDPAYTYCATAPLPENIDECLLAGYLRKKKVEMVRCLTQGMEVPADADIIIEGYVDPMETPVWEGPFGDHTGFYSLPDRYPLFHVTCITHRRNAVYPATIVGIPPQEDAYFACATERIFLAPIRVATLPELDDLHMPPAGTAHNLALARITKTYPGQGAKTIHSLWGSGQMMFNKTLIVTDFPIRGYTALLQKALERIDFHRDLIFSHGPLDVLDHTSPQFAYGSKWGLDATSKTPEEESRETPSLRTTPKQTTSPLNAGQNTLDVEAALKRHPEFTGWNLSLLAQNIPLIACSLSGKVAHDKATLSRFLFEEPMLEAIKVFVLVEEGNDILDWAVVAWLTCSNLDPARDISIHPERQQMVLNAASKLPVRDGFQRLWPNKVLSSPHTIQRVDSRWPDYHIGPFISSPSLRYGNPAQQEGAFAPDIES